MTTLIQPICDTGGVLALDYVARSDCAGLIVFSNDAANSASVCVSSAAPSTRSTEIDATMRVATDRYDGLLRRLAD